MNKQLRLTIILFVVIMIVTFVSGILIPQPNLLNGISVYRTSTDHSKRMISVYTDFVKSDRHSVVQPHEYDSDMQYIVTVNCDYDSISVCEYRPKLRKWNDVEIVDLGNDQYSINAIPVYYYYSYSRTVTYCISVKKGENVKKYYFTTKCEKDDS